MSGYLYLNLLVATVGGIAVGRAVIGGTGGREGVSGS